jgi:hypothetical protein
LISANFNGLFLDSKSLSAELGSIGQWIKFRLGEPILGVELDPDQISVAVEESLIQYSAEVAKFKMKNSYLSLVGIRKSTITKVGFSSMPSLSFVKRYVAQYGTDANAGGQITYNKAFIWTENNRATYNLKTEAVDLVTGGPISLTGMFIPKIIFHNPPNANLRYFDPMNTSNFLLYKEFGNGEAWQINSRMLYAMPLYEHMLRFQFFANFDKLFKSQYKWNVIGEELTISPVPVQQVRLFIKWIDSVTFDEHFGNRLDGVPDSSLSAFATDVTDIPFTNVDYGQINDFSKNWIRQYSLAICKEMVGLVRSKHQNIPVPDTDIILNGAELVAEGRESQNKLKEDLTEFFNSIISSEAVKREGEIINVGRLYVNQTPLGLYKR